MTQVSTNFPSWIFLSMLVGFGLAMVTIFKPKLARITGLLYAVAQGIAWRDPAGGDGARGRAPHQPVDIAFVPHIDRARGTGRNRDAEDRDHRHQGIDMPRRDHQPDF